MIPTIETTGLCKRYKTQKQDAVHNFSFSVMPGEIVGILGPNGAGKSTLIKLLLGVIRPSAGSVQVLGTDPGRFKNVHKKQIGVYFGGKSNLLYHLPVMDSLSLFQSIYQIPKDVFQHNLEHYAALLQCTGFLHQRVATLSLGQRLRADLLCILLYEPQLLVLDEPTLGLDIEGKRQFRDMLSTLVQEKHISIVITTHDVNDMQKLCSRILMVCQGEKVMDWTSGEFETLLNLHQVAITDIMVSSLPEGVQFIERDGKNNRYLVPAETVPAFRSIVHSHPYEHFAWEQPRLEDLLYAYYQ